MVQKRSCIIWNLTSFREAHENVFIKNDLPLLCRGISPIAMCFEREQNCEEYGSQSRQYLHSWEIVTYTQ